MRYLPALLLSLVTLPLFAQPTDRDAHHTVVFQQEGRFAGWPANYGIWSWGNEILVGFKDGVYLKNPTGGHDIDSEAPDIARQARSLDGGETWNVEEIVYLDGPPNNDKPLKLTKKIDFSNPDLALQFRFSTLYVSQDRGKSWNGPYELPTFGRPKLLARNDYIIEGPQQLTAFVAVAKDNGKEGQGLCIRTVDGGLTWNKVGWIGKQPDQEYGYAIMPATVALDNDSYLSIIRRGGKIDGKKTWWIESFLSPDYGKSWYQLKDLTLVNGGNPATLTRLDDDTLAMAYGMRVAPYGIRARISKDNGQSWSRELILRSDSASWDIGYPRSVLRPDGKMVTIYYYHTGDQKLRFIGCTIWDPKKVWY